MDILAISLDDLDWMMLDAREIYKRKLLLQKAMLKFLGVNE